MLPYPEIDPEIIRIGPIAVRWYGLMYLLGFISSYLLVRYQLKRLRLGIGNEFLEGLYTYIILGLIIGARLGYVIFYNLSYYIKNPIEIFAIWHGGMSFHGGLIGSVLAGIMFCRKANINVWLIADLIAATAPIGIGFGRIGNFINGELYGRVTDVPWAMVFPHAGDLPRHPSQLYEFFLEGIVLFTILWTLKGKGFKKGVIFSLFIIFYGLFRFIVEFFREPDPHIGFIMDVFTTGQLLSGFMIIAGIFLFIWRNRV